MNLVAVASARRVFLRQGECPLEEQNHLKKSFFTSVCLPNGTHKTTRSGRLTDLDLRLQDLLYTGSPIHLLDVGISSGITTLELIECLERGGSQVTGIGLDLRIHSLLRSAFGIDVLYDPEGNILQIATPLFARGRPDRSQSSLASRLLRHAIDMLERTVVRRWLASPQRAHPLALVNTRLADRPGFAVVEHDISVPNREWLDSFDLIRAANVLNLAYFPPEQIATIVRNLASWLRPGGLLAVCRTHELEGKNHASIFAREPDGHGFRLVERLETGSEIESIVLEQCSS